MTRKIRYKDPTQNLTEMSAPSTHSSNRASVGMDKFIGEYFFFSVDKLIPYKNQARSSFDEEELNKLADTIKIHGIRNPLTVIRSPDFEGKYEVVSGERRLKAAKIAGLEKVPCIILDQAADLDEIAIIENVQRSDLHPIELARGLKILIDNYGWGGQVELEKRVGIKQSRISEVLKLLNLSKEIQDLCISGNYTGRDNLTSLLKLESDQERREKILSTKGKSHSAKESFSVLRIKLENNSFKIQKNALNKLSVEQKEELKAYLKDILNELI